MPPTHINAFFGTPVLSFSVLVDGERLEKNGMNPEVQRWHLGRRWVAVARGGAEGDDGEEGGGDKRRSRAGARVAVTRVLGGAWPG